MPHYQRGDGALVRKRKFKFDDAQHMARWLSRTHEDNPVWKTHFQEKAAAHSGEGFRRGVLRKIATKKPHSLTMDVFSELRKFNKGERVGGGVGEALGYFASVAADKLGFQAFQEFVGSAPVHRQLPEEDQLFAKALSETYKSVSERRANIGGLERLPEYDSPRYSVWKEPNNQLLVTIHGTEGSNAADWIDDAKIALGSRVESDEVQALFTRLDATGKTYDVAAHSLGTQFVVNGNYENADRILLFNPAASPLQDIGYIAKQANDPNFTFYVNPSDVVSKPLWQSMNDETVDRSFVSESRYSPLAAHSMSQWFDDDGEGQKIEPTPESTRDEIKNYAADQRLRVRADAMAREHYLEREGK